MHQVGIVLQFLVLVILRRDRLINVYRLFGVRVFREVVILVALFGSLLSGVRTRRTKLVIPSAPIQQLRLLRFATIAARLKADLSQLRDAIPVGCNFFLNVFHIQFDAFN